MAPQVVQHANASCGVSIYRIYYNSPGSDDGSNTSLNAEWIQLTNNCSTGKSLYHWTIKDAAGHTYTFGTYTLAAGTKGLAAAGWLTDQAVSEIAYGTRWAWPRSSAPELE